MTQRGETRRRRYVVGGDCGYTLLEVLIVLVIIAMAAALVGPRLVAQLDRSKITAARVQMRAIGSALDAFRMDVGRYPTISEGLGALSDQRAVDVRAVGNWQGPYLDGAVPDDPWGNAYQYSPPAALEGRPGIVSFGADGEAGGEGIGADIVNGAREE